MTYKKDRLFQSVEWMGLTMSMKDLTPKNIKEELRHRGLYVTKSELKKMVNYTMMFSKYFFHMMSLDAIGCRPKGDKWYKPNNFKELREFNGVL